MQQQNMFMPFLNSMVLQYCALYVSALWKRNECYKLAFGFKKLLLNVVETVLFLAACVLEGLALEELLQPFRLKYFATVTLVSEIYGAAVDAINAGSLQVFEERGDEAFVSTALVGLIGGLSVAVPIAIDIVKNASKNGTEIYEDAMQKSEGIFKKVRKWL